MVKPYIFINSLLAVTLISGGILASSFVSADDSVVDEVSITVPVSCTMSGTGMNTHNTEITNGTYTANIGTTTIHAFCNDNEGFAIYAAGYTGDEIGATNSNKLVGTSASGNATIETGLATSAGNPDVSNWAMKLTMTQDSGDTTGTNAFTIDNSFNAYHVVPNKYTKVAHKNSGTDMTANTGGVKLTTTYAAYISKTQPADTYTGQVIYTLVHPASHSAPSSISCNPNGTTIGTNTSTDIKCMQDFASLSSSTKTALINSMAEGTQYTLIDKRDEKTYTIAKLKAGTDTNTNEQTYRVWMTKNLDLDLDSGTTYTNLDTDLGWNTSTSTYGTASWTPMRSTYETSANNTHAWCQGGTWNSQDGYCVQNNTPESYDPGDLYLHFLGDYDSPDVWNYYFFSCDFTTSTPSCDESLSPLSGYAFSTGTQQYHLGNYYNWVAAIASNDASIYGAYNETTHEYENLETHQSICPAGWTLPYSTWNNNLSQPEGDFVDLWTEYDWTENDGFSDVSTIWSAPLYSVFAGGFKGHLGYVGHYGYLWTSIADGGSGARYAYFGVTGDVVPADLESRSYGYSVRCLLR